MDCNKTLLSTKWRLELSHIDFHIKMIVNMWWNPIYINILEISVEGLSHKLYNKYNKTIKVLKYPYGRMLENNMIECTLLWAKTIGVESNILCERHIMLHSFNAHSCNMRIKRY